MAPTHDERAQVRDLVHWIYERSGSTSWADFARRCEVLPSQMSDWSRGVNAPSSYNLVKMLRVAGAIDDPAASDRPSETALLTEIVTRLEEDPTAAAGELAPLLGELSDQLAELSFRLRQAVARQGERWHRG